MTGEVPLGRLLTLHAGRAPERPALILDGQTIGFAELDARANRRARMLARNGVQEGDFVTVGLPNGLEFYETSFALWKLGAVPNLVSYRLSQPEIDAIAGLVDPKLVIGLQPGGRHAVPAGLPLDESLSADPLPDAISPYWKAVTSGGSTGRPKVIVDRLPGRWDPDSPVLAQRSGDLILNPGPLYHNAPFHVTHCGLFTGSTVIEMGRFDAARALTLMAEHGVTWVLMVPTMMHRVWRLGTAERARHDISCLRVLYHLGAPCPPWLKEAWMEWIGPEHVLELYSGTERLGATTITGADWLRKRGSVGRVDPGAQIRILDEAGEPVPAGTVGEVFFRPDTGPGSTTFYLGSEPNRRGEWESLGDLGHFDSDGYLFLSDRRKDMIISGGANIYPAEVEAALEAHPDVHSSLVIGLPDEDLGERVHAVVQCDPAAGLDADALLAFAAMRLTKTKLPRTIEFTVEPLRDEAGKSRRSAARAARIEGARP